MDRDSFYLMTPKKESVEIADWIAQLTNDKTDVVIDASAGIGGNSFAFARDNRVNRVYSIEINPTRFTALVSNALALGLDKITAIHSDFVEWMHSDEFSNLEKTNSCVFVDPPWGGPDYKNLEVIEDLYLSNADDATKTSMTDICTELIAQVPCIVLKLPFNFDFEGFKQRLDLDRAVQVETLHRGNIVFMALYK